MRDKRFRFTRGDIVHVPRGFEWATSVKPEEDVVILEAREEQIFGRMSRRYLVQNPVTKKRHIVAESFLRKTVRKAEE